MQLMSDTVQRFGAIDPDEPITSLAQRRQPSVRWLLDLFTDVRLTPAAYNAGEGSVQRYGKAIPPYTETYVRGLPELYWKEARQATRRLSSCDLEYSAPI